MIDFFKNTSNIAKRFAITYIFIGIFGILFLDKFIKVYLISNNYLYDNSIVSFGVTFIILTGILIHFIVNYMQKIIKNIENAYEKLKEEEKDRLIPFEFALNNSVDGFHWFTLEGRYIYVNDAICEMDGYTKEEFLNMHLEDVNPNFTRQSTIEVMESIKNTANWRLETTHKRKDGTIYPVEVSGHCFKYKGKDYIMCFARDKTKVIESKNKITAMNEELQKSLSDKECLLKEIHEVNEELQKSVAEKEILLKEIHHRVKNNMEIISSVLYMQAYKSDDKKFKDAMKESRSKIHAMALVHEFLYLGENLAYINVNEYIKRLLEDIKELYISQNTDIDINLDIDKLQFSINRCIQVGMVLHELCVNALKYAFKEDRDNLLCIHMNAVGENIHVKIRDNGDEIVDVDNLQKSDSIGMQLVHSIVDFQLKGNIEFKNNNGLECNITFPKKEKK